MKKLLVMALLTASLVGCTSDADIASKNISRAADQFEVPRRIVFYNTMSSEYMLSVEGLCSLGNNDTPGRLTITCKTGPTSFKKHYLGLSENVSFVVEQLDPITASPYQYRVAFKPLSLIPSVDIRK